MSVIRGVASNVSPILLAILLAAISFAKEDQKTSLKQQTPASSACGVSLDFDPATELNAVREYTAAVQQLFVNGDFNDVDCLADSARRNKEKFKGGAWKLHNLYAGLYEPKGHATEEDWDEHFKRLERWMAAKPDSITARVALGWSYVNYAWDARGTGAVDSVTDSGWRLFNERLDLAESALAEARQLKTKCPEWYLAMQHVAFDKNWGLARESALLQEAVAFEPGYYYFYRMQAYYLEPKWYGEEGDAERFIAETADKVGGDKGDMLYFQVASYLVCHCGGENLKRLSWPRLQKATRPWKRRQEYRWKR